MLCRRRQPLASAEPEHTLTMSGMFVLWQTARHAGDLARTAAPYHALGATLAQRPFRLPAPQQAAALQLQRLVAAYLQYQEGQLAHYQAAVQCVAACTAYWQGRGALPCHWRRIRNQVLRFEFSLARPLFLSSRVYAVTQDLYPYISHCSLGASL